MNEKDDFESLVEQEKEEGVSLESLKESIRGICLIGFRSKKHGFIDSSLGEIGFIKGQNGWTVSMDIESEFLVQKAQYYMLHSECYIFGKNDSILIESLDCEYGWNEERTKIIPDRRKLSKKELAQTSFARNVLDFFDSPTKLLGEQGKPYRLAFNSITTREERQKNSHLFAEYIEQAHEKAMQIESVVLKEALVVKDEINHELNSYLKSVLAVRTYETRD